MKTFIIAEAGVNHNGREDLAFELVEAAAHCGADAVKFQTFSADRLVRAGARTASYQQLQTGLSDQRELLKALELPLELHVALFERCVDLGIEFLSTPFDERSADFLAELGMSRFKIPSGEITNEPFLRHIARFGRPMILSTGMADMTEIKRAIEVIGEAWSGAGLGGMGPTDLTILHCTSNYPAAYTDINLRAMRTIANETGFRVGYSDHSLGVAVSTGAVALGAVVIEKHFSTDPTLPGPDHAASLSIGELGEMVKQIRAIEVAMGSPEKRPSASELPVRSLVRRSVTAIRNLSPARPIEAEDIAVLRPGDGIAPRYATELVGRNVAREIPAGTTLQWADIQ